MKRFILWCFGLFLTSFVFGAEVSQRKEVAVMSVYSSYNLPSSAYMYFDDRMIATIASMKRFQVIGYQYRLDGTTAQRFIERIRELKKQAALQNPQYRDEDLGIAVIPASEMERLVNSVFVFIPSINGFDSKSYDIQIPQPKKGGGYEIRIVKEHKATVNVSIKIIDTAGNLLSTYDNRGEAISRNSANEAYQKAVNDAMEGLAYYLRNVEEFKIKTGVLRVDGNFAYLELGKNLGISPGYEFAIEEEVTVMGRFTEKRRTGLIRVSYVSDEYSYGHIIFGSPKPGDQLIEAPKAGRRFGISFGPMPFGVPAKATLSYPSLPDLNNTQLSFSSLNGFAPALMMQLDLESGYSWLWETGFGMGFVDPFMLYLTIGPAYEWYMRNTSLVVGTKFAISIGAKDVMELPNEWGLTIEGKDFSYPVKVSLNWFDFALQPFVSYNIQFNQSVKLRFFGGFHWSFYQMAGLYFREDTGSDQSGESVFVKPHFTDWNGTLSTTGVFGGVEIIFRL
ncbi:hypothetical protein [Thermospira aquatica]|uniref:Curli production assembly/transport component CsgG n=1 Tax=Thermospira aquatica TaxID=2828656 RepID=A0AAX3BEK3_9SPIR|nr:hypothetical protein [Thermospira aquatica]URA10479.1 hypothetical protein KDW03_01365 [Thermospira aquatica]